MDRQKAIRGIAAYEHEQRMFLRLLRKRGQFNERDFDSWFRGREWRRQSFCSRGITGDTFLLGIGTNGMNKWAEMLDLLQIIECQEISPSVSHIETQRLSVR